MKQLSIEEKAKAYDESKERMKDFLKEWENCGALGEAMEKAKAVFPELKESEDERIREDMIETIKKESKDFPSSVIAEKSHIWLAWLEKQSEQKEQLINKACDLLVNCIEDFMLRRMEIWDEECKKQTLENIRKKLEE